VDPHVQDIRRQVAAAHRMHVRATGLTSSLPAPIASPHSWQVP
jgi:hypothetical protein